MTTSPAVRTIAAAPYGASELQRLAHRYLFIALGISIAIHLLVLCLYYVLPAFDNTDAAEQGRNIGIRIIDFTPPTLRYPVLPPPAGGTTHTSAIKNATPVPVPESQASTEELPTQDALSRQGTTIPGDDALGGPGPTGIIVEDPTEEPPADFVPVEKPPVIVHSAVPEYPPLALRADIQGRVVVRVWVDKQGRPKQVNIWSSTNEIFNEAALEAARKYLFVPAYMNAGPVSVWVSLAFNFKLK